LTIGVAVDDHRSCVADDSVYDSGAITFNITLYLSWILAVWRLRRSRGEGVDEIVWGSSYNALGAPSSQSICADTLPLLIGGFRNTVRSVCLKMSFLFSSSSAPTVPTVVNPTAPNAKSLPDDKDVKDAKATPTGTPLSVALGGMHRSVALALAHRASSKGKGSKGGSPAFQLDIMSGAINLSTSAGGVFSTLLGGGQIGSTTDWTALQSLFDIARVSGFTVHYQPIGMGQGSPGVAGSNLGTHVPLFCAGDPDAVNNVPFLSLLGTRPLSEKANRYHNTGLPWQYRYKFPVQKKVVYFGSTTVPSQPTLGQWVDVSGTVNGLVNSCGGYLISIFTNTNNASVTLGYFVVQWHTEWNTRL